MLTRIQAMTFGASGVSYYYRAPYRGMALCM